MGDFVYADGTFSDQYDEGKTVVGVCWYIDPHNKENILIVALKPIGSEMWGIESNGIKLADAPDYNTQDVAQLKNWGGSGIEYGEMRDKEYGDTYGWKIFPSTNIRSHVGFTKVERAIGNVDEGDVIPIGQYETLLIIEHRNKILRDSGINLPVPTATSSKTEQEVLTELMAANTSVLTYYYPAASRAYAYQPAVMAKEKLANKFKAHNWFLPSGGDIARIAWYMQQIDDDEKGIFEKAIRLGLMSRIPDRNNDVYGGWYTSSENGADAAVAGNLTHFANYYRGYFLKSKKLPVCPICKL